MKPYTIVLARSLHEAKRRYPKAVYFVRHDEQTWAVSETADGILNYMETRYEN